MSQANSSDDETDFKAVNSTNYERIQQKVKKINYADGIADGRDQVFQSSFDMGYSDGLRAGLELAKLQSFYDTLKEAKIDENLANESRSYKQLKLAKPTDKSHFRFLDHQTEPLSVVAEKQRVYVDNLLENFAETLQTTTNLFKSSNK